MLEIPVDVTNYLCSECGEKLLHDDLDNTIFCPNNCDFETPPKVIKQ